MTASVLILIIAAMILAAALSMLVLDALTRAAPLGWQDATGFHFGNEPC